MMKRMLGRRIGIGHVRRGRTLIRLIALLLGLASLAGSLTPTFAGSMNCTALLHDSGLETGAGWQTQSNGSYSLFSNYLVHEGDQAAYLAGVDGADDRLITSLSVPADQSTTLRFWWQVHTQESSGGADSLTVLVADASGNPLRGLITLGDSSASTVWQQAEFDLSAFAGQTIQLQFQARTDSSLPSDFFVDDVEATACGTASSASRLFLPALQR